MSNTPVTEKWVLAIDPTNRVFGYLVFEGPDLIDWGATHVHGLKNRASIAAAGELIRRHRPQIMVLEDMMGWDCRRRLRVRELAEALERYGRERGLQCGR